MSSKNSKIIKAPVYNMLHTLVEKGSCLVYCMVWWQIGSFSVQSMLRSVVNGDPEKTILQVKTYIIMHVITFVMPRFLPLIV